MTSSLVSSWKTIVSSMRFRNSGRKCALSASLTFSFMRSWVTTSEPLPKPIAALRRSAVPRFEVMIRIVFLKSTARPWESVRRPSSRICSSVLKTSGWAFSTSSKSTTREGLAAHGLGELAALVVADVARGRADEATDTECFSMYSLMSSWMSASSSSKRNSASVLASSVLPTPVGPRKMNDPPGRFGSFRPARVRRIARD